MLLKYSDKLTIQCLKNICKINKIKYINKYNKKTIIDLLNKTSAAKIIQLNFRIKHDFNKICPISYEKITYPWICIKNRNKFIYYDFNTFIKYLNRCSELIDPCTRNKISLKKINEINKLILYYKGKLTSKIIVANDMIKNIDFNILISCIYDLINDLERNIVGLQDMYSIYLPRFIHYFTHLINNHPKDMTDTVIKASKEMVNNETIYNYILIMENINIMRQD